MVVWHMVGGVEFGIIEREEIGNGGNVVRFRKSFVRVPVFLWRCVVEMKPMEIRFGSGIELISDRS